MKKDIKLKIKEAQDRTNSKKRLVKINKTGKQDPLNSKHNKMLDLAIKKQKPFSLSINSRRNGIVAGRIRGIIKARQLPLYCLSMGTQIWILPKKFVVKKFKRG